MEDFRQKASHANFEKFEETEKAGQEALKSVMRKDENDDPKERLRALILFLILNDFGPQLRKSTLEFEVELNNVITMMSEVRELDRQQIPRL